ncbi:hypothetical protein EDI_273490 [Entamoeba dispar SAW760]|uniref:Uncharacterized protein n=1 Tax=Entamoeba dispar (strain ATCC PRA-260 / SAW760) TaxID=370354 RepID=B0EJ10_ENTDS|nr:uncharacterized protein EDI_273490 [Entamoeba dispar SAW760]EDR25491.1 hypothetical protein EDI_273490 [Entamoeba dispar SAW760]|eukprot:EDR25491.1 hypothetical protein EDI_273490 [Entamoeba dispar SAW760]
MSKAICIDKLKTLIIELAVDIDDRLKTNLTTDGRSLLYAISFWVHQLIFVKEYEYDPCLDNYIRYLLNDIKNFLVNYSNIERIVGEIAFFYHDLGNLCGDSN